MKKVYSKNDLVCKLGVMFLVCDKYSPVFSPLEDVYMRIIYLKESQSVILHSDDFLLKTEYLGIPFEGATMTKKSSKGIKITLSQAEDIFKEMINLDLRNSIF